MSNNKNLKLHFAHANGFPAGSYKKLFSYLDNSIDVFALEKFAHDHAYPVSKEWHLQAQELADFIETHSAEPIYAVGHSFGAVISYMAACQYPHLFRGLIMLDPPLVTGITGMFIRMAKKVGFFDKFTPAKKASTRCTTWPLDTDLVDYFAQKGLFKDMHIDCVQDYVNAAINQHPQAYKLNFDHQVEAELFRTVPLNINRFYGRLNVPSLLVTGGNTTVCRPHLIRPFVKANAIEHQVFQGGGHMFPLESPQQVAELINQQIRQWQDKG